MSNVDNYEKKKRQGRGKTEGLVAKKLRKSEGKELLPRRELRR